MSSTINDDCNCDFDRKAQKATDALLNLLAEHHDFAVPRDSVTRPQVIEIKSEPEESVPVDIGILPVPEGRLTVDGIKRVVCRHFGISHNDMISPRRDHKVQRPRMVAIFLSRELTARSLPEIGRKFGGRDHSTIIAAIRRGAALLASGDPISRDVEYLREVLMA